MARAPVGVCSRWRTIALALFVLGGFLLVTPNLERLADEWRRGAEMSVFLADDVSDDRPPDHRGGCWRRVTVVAASSSCRKPTRWCASSRCSAIWRPLPMRSTANPLPASYEVRLQSDAPAARPSRPGRRRLRQTPGVSDVRYDRQWLDRLLSVVDPRPPHRPASLGGVLTLAAALTVANVVRLALFARRDEIEIMELVGAPQVYIRGPFVMEGRPSGRHRRVSWRWPVWRWCSWRCAVDYLVAAGGDPESVRDPIFLSAGMLPAAGRRGHGRRLPGRVLAAPKPRSLRLGLNLTSHIRTAEPVTES